MVEFVDGSILAQLGPTDMRMPIQYALTYPERVPSNGCALDWSTLRKLDFAAVPRRKFPCLTLAKEAVAAGRAAALRLKRSGRNRRSRISGEDACLSWESQQ